MSQQPHGARRKPSPGRRARAGFSLVELLVVITIIIILVSLLVSSFMARQGPLSQTRAALAALQSAETEAETAGNPHMVVQALLSRPNPINWAITPVAVNGPGVSGTALLSNATVTGSADIQKYSGARFVWTALQNPDCAKMIYAVGSNWLKPDSTGNFLVPLDGWGNPIIYVAGVSHDHTIGDPNYTADTSADFLPQSPRPYFASAGPDGVWGTVDNNGVPDANAQDNLYSYEISR